MVDRTTCGPDGLFEDMSGQPAVQDGFHFCVTSSKFLLIVSLGDTLLKNGSVAFCCFEVGKIKNGGARSK